MKTLKNIIMWRGYVYRATMRIAHKFNWHYAPPSYPEGDTHLWCRWCGFRQTVYRGPKNGTAGIGESQMANRDGKGPKGQGPKTGRGKGKCK